MLIILDAISKQILLQSEKVRNAIEAGYFLEAELGGLGDTKLLLLTSDKAIELYEKCSNLFSILKDAANATIDKIFNNDELATLVMNNIDRIMTIQTYIKIDYFDAVIKLENLKVMELLFSERMLYMLRLIEESHVAGSITIMYLKVNKRKFDEPNYSFIYQLISLPEEKILALTSSAACNLYHCLFDFDQVFEQLIRLSAQQINIITMRENLPIFKTFGLQGLINLAKSCYNNTLSSINDSFSQCTLSGKDFDAFEIYDIDIGPLLGCTAIDNERLKITEKIADCFQNNFLAKVPNISDDDHKTALAFFHAHLNNSICDLIKEKKTNNEHFLKPMINAVLGFYKINFIHVYLSSEQAESILQAAQNNQPQKESKTFLGILL